MNDALLSTKKGCATESNLVVILLSLIRAISDDLLTHAMEYFLGKGEVAYPVKLHGVPMTVFSEDGLSAIATKHDTPLMLDSYTLDMCIKSCGRSSYARALIEIQADVELKDNIIVALHKLVGEGSYTCNIHVEYEWKPPMYACCNTNANTNGDKKKYVEPTKEVSNSNPFDVLNSVKNVDLGTNGGTSNLASKKANSSGSSFWNVESSSTSSTPIVDKTDKIERLIIDGKVTLVDDE
ncbi:hypothetical protein Tco_0995952, partial [Tanacetum coccineum]